MSNKKFAIVKDVEAQYKTDLRSRLFNFAVDIFKVLKSIDGRKEYDVFRYQLSKCGTSIGANYEESQGAYSRKEFASKIGICLKEAREANYFLRLIDSMEIGNKNSILRLINESEEISKILAAILIKLRKS